MVIETFGYNNKTLQQVAETPGYYAENDRDSRVSDTIPTIPRQFREWPRL